MSDTDSVPAFPDEYTHAWPGIDPSKPLYVGGKLYRLSDLEDERDENDCN